MGRPIDKQFFGTNGIACMAKVGSNAVAAATIVSQTSTREFMVLIGSTISTVNLVAVDAAALGPDQMMIYVKLPDNSVTFVQNLKGHVLTTAAGTQYVWNTGVTGNVAPAAISKVGALVAPAPVITITSQPAVTQTVTHPATASFSVTATVTQGATLTYQWKKNGTVVSGATLASYTTPATVTGDNNSIFTVVVSAVGATSVTSNNATLLVN